MPRITRPWPALAAVVALPLTGCSAIHDAVSPPETSMMATQKSAPSVETDDTGAPDGATDGSGDSTDIQIKPTQIWIRSASYANGAYKLTVASEPKAKFMVYDAQPTDQDNSAHGDCTADSSAKLASSISGALKDVTQQYELTCSSPKLTLPSIVANWNSMDKNTASAIFALGDISKQGKPDANPDANPEAATENPDLQLISSRWKGRDLEATVWVTRGAMLNVGAFADSGSVDSSEAPPTCETKPLGGTKPGKNTSLPMHKVKVSCTGVTLKKAGIDALLQSGKVGKAPAMSAFSVEVPHR